MTCIDTIISHPKNKKNALIKIVEFFIETHIEKNV